MWRIKSESLVTGYVKMFYFHRDETAANNFGWYFGENDSVFGADTLEMFVHRREICANTENVM